MTAFLPLRCQNKKEGPLPHPSPKKANEMGQNLTQRKVETVRGDRPGGGDRDEIIRLPIDRVGGADKSGTRSRVAADPRSSNGRTRPKHRDFPEHPQKFVAELRPV